jgi:hypothetical protein
LTEGNNGFLLKAHIVPLWVVDIDGCAVSGGDKRDPAGSPFRRTNFFDARELDCVHEPLVDLRSRASGSINRRWSRRHEADDHADGHDEGATGDDLDPTANVC